jgi:ABC-type bacteriocin/lantibiotic exporter with double-glycine peptidase domain
VQQSSHRTDGAPTVVPPTDYAFASTVTSPIDPGVAATAPARASSGLPRQDDIDLSERTVQTLVYLAQLLGVSCTLDDARQAISRAGDMAVAPIEPLARAAAAVGLRVTPVRMSVADAIWAADAMTPVVAWSVTEQRWLVIRKRGLFGARVSTADAPLERLTMSRDALAARLGLDSAIQSAEFGMVQPVRLMPSSHAPDELELGHGHEHGAHLTPLRRYMGALRPEAPEAWAIVIYSVVSALLYLALPLAVSAFVGNLSFGSQSDPFIQALLFLGIALFAALALIAIIRGLQIYTAEVIQRRLFVRLAADLTWRIPRASHDAFEGTHPPELVNRMLDIVTVQKVTVRMLVTGVDAALGAVVGTLVLAFYHPALLLFSVLMCVGIGVVLLAGRGAVAATTVESQRKYEMVAWLEELARAPALFKGPGGFAFAQDRADLIARQFLGARKRFFRVFMRQIGLLLLLEVLATSSLLLVGGWLVLEQQITLGQLVASELIVSAIVVSMTKLAYLFETWYDGLVAIDKVGYLTDLVVERQGGEPRAARAGGAAVEVRDVAFAYAGVPPVLAGFDLDLRPGECVGLWGAQGRGSSTVLNLLFGHGTPDAGSIRIDDLDVRSWSLEHLRTQVALLRGADIVHGTIADNVRLGRFDVGHDGVSEALERIGLLDEVLELPAGLDTLLITGGLPLTSRQRVRLVLARALVHQPRLLLIDDMLDGLDDAAIDAIFRTIRDPRCGWTVLVATRDPLVAERCDRFVELGNPSRSGAATVPLR